MTAAVFQPPNIHALADDSISSASNLSFYAAGDHTRITSGDFIYESSPHKPHNRPSSFPNALLEENLVTSKPLDSSSQVSSNTNKKANKQRREFMVSRKNSYKGPNYFNLKSKTTAIKSIKNNKRASCKFGNPTQMDPVFELNPQSSLLENPSYMVQYFTKTLDLLKKDPDIKYQILKAHIDLSGVRNTDDTVQQIKQKKYQSLPAPTRANTIKRKVLSDRKNQRKSAPAVLVYKPTNMTMTEYLNTPLDIYKHKKQLSDASTTDRSRLTGDTGNTGNTGSSNVKSRKTVSTGIDSVSTAALYQKNNRLSDESNKTKTQSLKTTRKDDIIKKRSIVFKSTDSVIERSASDLSIAKNNKYLSKMGTPLIENSALHQVISKTARPHSNHGAVSIASGTEFYGLLKAQIFGERFDNWQDVMKYMKEEYPELETNEYFLSRLMFEIYFRRILAARISMKLGLDSKNKGSANDIWIGLRESIAAVYGEENASFFETQLP